MTFYQELQLSSTGSKQLIKNTTDKKEKTRHILIYNFKVYLVVAFCFLVVTAFSMIFGNDNSVPGVVVLLAILEMCIRDRDKVASFMSSPVKLKTETFYSVENYGTATTPFYTCLLYTSRCV